MPAKWLVEDQHCQNCTDHRHKIGEQARPPRPDQFHCADKEDLSQKTWHHRDIDENHPALGRWQLCLPKRDFNAEQWQGNNRCDKGQPRKKSETGDVWPHFKPNRISRIKCAGAEHHEIAKIDRKRPEARNIPAARRQHHPK